MDKWSAALMIASAVTLLGGCAYGTRLYLNMRKSLGRSQKSLGNGWRKDLPPLGYQELQMYGNPREEDTQGLTIGPRLGYSSFGVVYHGRWKGARVAVKVLYHDKGNRQISVHIAREVVISAALVHPNIVTVHFVSTEEGMGAQTNGLETYIVMDYCDRGTLAARRNEFWRLLKEDRIAAVRWIKRALMHIAGGLQYMHSLGLVHGNLKCNNVLLQSTRCDLHGFDFKIANIGCSPLLPATKDEVLTRSYGFPTYAAPELLEGGRLSQASDIYAFAIIAWHLLSLGDRFFSKPLEELYMRIVDLNNRPTFPLTANAELKKLIKDCWAPVPLERPLIGDVVSRIEALTC